jgi:hypothetical protein
MDIHEADYFSLPLPTKDVGLSPHPTQYESHGFIPLCSVAVVEKGDETGDYFSHPLPTTIPASESDLGSSITTDSSDTPSPRFDGFTSTADVPIEELRHQTGSPLQDRDIASSPDRYWYPELPTTVPQLRGGGVRNPLEDIAEEERRRCNLTGSPVPDLKDALTRLEDEDRVFHEALERLERAVWHIGVPINQGPSTSDYSGSEYSSVYHTGVDGVEDGAPDAQSLVAEKQMTQTEALSMTEDAWQHIAVTTALPDGSDSDDSDMVDDNSAELFRPGSEDIRTGIPGMAGEHANRRIFEMQSIEEEEPASLPSHSLIAAATEFRSDPPQPPFRPTGIHQSTTALIWCAREDTLFRIACNSNRKELAKCLSGPTINIANGSTGETYVTNVPERMLLHFCGEEVLEQLLPSYGAVQDVLEIPTSEAESLAIARVIRFMKRCCSPMSHKASGEMRIPPSIRDGLETIRACRVLGLLADAERNEKMSRDWMGSEAWEMTDETIDLIWSAYFGAFRESEMGDAIVWFVLNETQKNTKGLAEETWWLLDQEEYRTLKHRVREETVARHWRTECRVEFLDRCKKERQRMQRKRARREKKAREREARIEAIRATHRRETSSRLDEQSASNPQKWEAPESWLLASGDADTNSEALAESSRSIVDDKPLPKLPLKAQLQSDSAAQATACSGNEQQTRSTSALYADALRTVNQTSRQADDRDGLALDPHTPCTVPPPKKKRSILGRLLTAAFSG